MVDRGAWYGLESPWERERKRNTSGTKSGTKPEKNAHPNTTRRHSDLDVAFVPNPILSPGTKVFSRVAFCSTQIRDMQRMGSLVVFL